MPVFAADVLPDTSGRNLGSPSQRWNIFAQNADILGSGGGVIYVLTSPVTANANTTSGQGLMSCLIPAGLLNAPGKVLRVSLGGTYTTQAGQTPNMGLSVAIGNVNIFYTAAEPLQAGQARNIWTAEVRIIVYQAGAAAQVDHRGTLTFQPNSAAWIGQVMLQTSADTIGPIDLTVDQYLITLCSFNTNTSPANICELREFIVEVLN